MSIRKENKKMENSPNKKEADQEDPFEPGSLSRILWLAPATLVYLGLCMTLLGASYASLRAAGDESAKKLSQLYEIEKQAAEKQETNLQVAAIAQRDGVISIYRLVRNFAKA